MRFFFRTDANADIGYGHLMRCLTLANQLQTLGAQCYFICQAFDSFPHHLFLGNIELCLIQASNTQEDSNLSADVLAANNFDGVLDWLIIDHYSLGDNWASSLPKFNNLLVIDDLVRDHQMASVILDQSLGQTKQAYATKVTARCRLLVGHTFTLLRPEFLQFRARAEAKRTCFQANHLLISVGATDHLNISKKLLNSLAFLPSNYYPKVSIVLSSKAKHISEIKDWIIQHQAKEPARAISLLTDVSNMAKLILDADLAIGASGSSAWERAALGLATLSIVTAENQDFIAQSMLQRGICKTLDIKQNGNQIAKQIIDISTPESITAMSQAGLKTIDGKGCQRVIFEVLKNSHKAVSLRPFHAADASLIYSWQQQPGIRKYARTPHAPHWEEHRAWFSTQMSEQNVDIKLRRNINYIICFNHLACGLLRLSKVNDMWEVSILISQQFQRLGISSKALSLLLQRHKLPMIAEVSPENTSSKMLFLNAGFQAINDHQYLYTS